MLYGWLTAFGFVQYCSGQEGRQWDTVRTGGRDHAGVLIHTWAQLALGTEIGRRI